MIPPPTRFYKQDYSKAETDFDKAVFLDQSDQEGSLRERAVLNYRLAKYDSAASDMIAAYRSGHKESNRYAEEADQFLRLIKTNVSDSVRAEIEEILATPIKITDDAVQQDIGTYLKLPMPLYRTLSEKLEEKNAADFHLN